MSAHSLSMSRLPSLKELSLQMSSLPTCCQPPGHAPFPTLILRRPCPGQTSCHFLSLSHLTSAFAGQLDGSHAVEYSVSSSPGFLRSPSLRAVGVLFPGPWQEPLVPAFQRLPCVCFLLELPPLFSASSFGCLDTYFPTPHPWSPQPLRLQGRRGAGARIPTASPAACTQATASAA